VLGPRSAASDRLDFDLHELDPIEKSCLAVVDLAHWSSADAAALNGHAPSHVSQVLWIEGLQRFRGLLV
jgi:hypothetical protein